MFGGLANRMFQYAFYMRLKKLDKKVFLDNISFKPKQAHELVEFKNIFPNAELNISSKDDVFRLAGKNNFINRVRRKILLLHKDSFIKEVSFRYTEVYDKLDGDIYLVGHWQSEKYFSSFKDLILYDFSFNEFRSDKNKNILKKIQKEESVSIHIRKRKEHSNRKINKGTCGLDYYKNAIKFMNENLSNPKYYVFADNLEWVKENFTEFNYELIDWNPIYGPNSYLDMQLMSLCKHNIIANSTYSWWGAWLNRNPNKIVIGPEKWFSIFNPKYDTTDLLPDSWFKL